MKRRKGKRLRFLCRQLGHLLIFIMCLLFLPKQSLAPSRQWHKPFAAYKISPRPCQIGGNDGTCMFVWECIKTEGKHVGMCMDGFMFGSCCTHDVLSNHVTQPNTLSSTLLHKPDQISSESNFITSSISKPNQNSSPAHRPGNTTFTTTPSPWSSSLTTRLTWLTTKRPTYTQSPNDIQPEAEKPIASPFVSSSWASKPKPPIQLPPVLPTTEVTQKPTARPTEPHKWPSSSQTTTQSTTMTSNATATSASWLQISTSKPNFSPTPEAELPFITRPKPPSNNQTNPFITSNKPFPSMTTSRPTPAPPSGSGSWWSSSTTFGIYSTKSTTTLKPPTHPTSKPPHLSSSSYHSYPTRPPTSTVQSTLNLTSTGNTDTTMGSVFITSPDSTSTTQNSGMGNSKPVSVPSNVQNIECGVPPLLKPETRIVGGKNAPFGGFPWQVSVRRTSFFGFTSTHRCGGALLNENWIATAGHCVDDLLVSQIRLRVGEYDFSSVIEPYPYEERGASKKVVHPKYNFFTYEYDLALVRMDKPVNFQPHIAPICLPGADDLLIGENATVTGWGRLSEGGTLPTVLQQVTVPIVSNDKCKEMFLKAGRHEHIPEIFLCAGFDDGGRDSCQGDSGGPLQVKGKNNRYFLAGIISWGIGCAEPNLPGVCTRISKFVKWIMDTVT